ncbi:hypothetical protein EMEDMD4_170037 [Sinorhizobium medicae]|uniref:Uncharacterized protein n=1 Tax=Sinorhizobium medicae TaxID=110321 RepID=A0A508WT68_9HYPH|nr:hypothetical protein EMEDMD4_170037 [Sinorhizobium medicae]
MALRQIAAVSERRSLMDGIRHPSRPKGRHTQHAVDQTQLFVELIETRTTRDQPFEAADGSWGSCVSRPPGRGWRIIDSSHDKRTCWIRRIPIPWPVRPSPNGWGRR